jgi:hypothetical protein
VGFYSTAGRLIWNTSKAAGNAGQTLGAAINDQVDSRKGRRGLLGPGDPPPPPGLVGDFLDYRGVASARETSNLHGLEYPIGSSVRFGRGGGSLLGVPFDLIKRHAIVIGPAGSGKTESVIVPWIYSALRAGNTVVATDVKGDLKDRLKEYTSSRGTLGVPVTTWDYLAPKGGSTSWNWIGALNTDARLDAAIVGLIGRQERSQRPDLWNIDYEIGKGLIRFAQTHFRRPITADDLRATLDQDELEKDLRGNQRFPGYAELWPYTQMSPGDFVKATSGIRPALAALCTPDIRRVTEQPKLDIDSVLDHPGLVIIGARLSGGSVSERLAALALGVFQQRLFERLSQRHHDHHVLVVIDEAGPLLKRVDFARVMTTVRSGGVSVVLGFQAAEMIDDESERGTILSNAAITIAMRGMSEATADHLSKRFGTRTERVISDSSTITHKNRTRQVSHEQMPVIALRELQSPPFGDFCGVISLAGDSRVTSKPIMVDFTRRRP